MARSQPARHAGELEVGGRRLAIRNLDRVVPADRDDEGRPAPQYVRIGDVMLPHLRERLLHMHRYPEGVEGPRFWQKGCPEHRPPWLETAPVWSRDKQANIDFCVVNELAALLWAVNIGSIVRAGKVLIDWGQNTDHKSMVCAYSVRAKARPTASTPVRWSPVEAAVDGGDPALLVFEMADMLERVARDGDLFADVLTLEQRLVQPSSTLSRRRARLVELPEQARPRLAVLAPAPEPRRTAHPRMALERDADVRERAGGVEEPEQHGGGHLGEVAAERAAVAAAQVDVVAVAEGQAAKAVPLGLVDEPALGQLANERRAHRLLLAADHDATLLPLPG